MRVFSVCVNPESGIYVAFCADDPLIHARASSSEEAIGRLLLSRPGLIIDEAIDLDESWSKK
jgi:hypothetical protein